MRRIIALIIFFSLVFSNICYGGVLEKLQIELLRLHIEQMKKLTKKAKPKEKQEEIYKDLPYKVIQEDLCLIQILTNLGIKYKIAEFQTLSPEVYIPYFRILYEKDLEIKEKMDFISFICMKLQERVANLIIEEPLRALIEYQEKYGK